MKIKYIIYVFLFLIPVESISQNYSKYGAIYLADSLANSKIREYHKSLNLYEYVINNFKNKYEVYVKAAIVASKANDKESVYSFLDKAIDIGWKDTFLLNNERAFGNFKNEIQWTDLRNKITLNISNTNNKYDLDLQKKIYNSYNEDQNIRNKLVIVNGKRLYKLDSILTIMRKIDIKNQLFVHDLLTKSGFPDSNTVSLEARNMLLIMITHFDLSHQEMYLPIIHQLNTEPNIDKEVFLMIEDKILIKNGRKQKNGTQIEWNETTKKMELIPIEDCGVAEKIRTELDVQPLAIYLKSIGIKHPCK